MPLGTPWWPLDSYCTLPSLKSDPAPYVSLKRRESQGKISFQKGKRARRIGIPIQLLMFRQFSNNQKPLPLPFSFEKWLFIVGKLPEKQRLAQSMFEGNPLSSPMFSWKKPLEKDRRPLKKSLKKEQELRKPPVFEEGPFKKTGSSLWFPFQKRIGTPWKSLSKG